MNNFYIEEVIDYMGRAEKGTLIAADNVTAAKKAASKLKSMRKTILCLYKVTDTNTRNCKRIAVLSDKTWRNIDSSMKYKGVWNEAKI
ncbi:hypothetical protein [Thorsellia anophelis]|uniref:Uncharacterized protein n=1 Tax=Thorsellia anophelis DSM 18579 TaxID=1123402 RepID=A0A1I0FRM6_9GAMM|nr:hypothetical protein [Thorsellia anophelis]SET60290.1 hypothetical protein SAMN02583745_02853 [Thorsellia anophelis DSM 18579]